MIHRSTHKKMYVAPVSESMRVLTAASLLATSPSTDEAFARRKGRSAHSSHSIWGDSKDGLWSES